ncbi:unnamed protein product, partial [Brachionus calyciflorus]
FRKIATPIYKAAVYTNKSLLWTEECARAFKILKERLCGENVLALPNFEKPFIVETDACDLGIGGVLSQECEKITRPVAFYSKTLSPAEQKYSTSEKELLAIVKTVENFKYFLFGRTFKIVTDHQPLKWLSSVKEPAARLARWLIRLECYYFKIIYRKGSVNQNADGLSRLPIKAVGAENNEENCEFMVSFVELRAQTSDLKWISDLILEYGHKQPHLEPRNQTQLKLLREYKNLFLKNSILFRKFERNNKIFNQFVIVESDKKTVLDNFHKSLFAGHLGYEKTLNKIEERFYWTGMKKDVFKFVQECLTCQKVKQSRNVHSAKMVPLRPIRPLELIAADIVGPLPVATTGKKYILVIIDHFT